MPGGGGTSTVQKADPWAGAQPGLLNMYAQSNALAMGPGQQFYPGSTVAGQSAATQGGLNALQQTATTQSDNLTNSLNGNAQTMGGNFLGSNPANAGLGAIGNTDFAANTPAMQQLLQSAGKSLDPSITGGLTNYGLNDFASTSPALQQLMQSTGYNVNSAPGQQALIGTANGQMLNSNPYVDAMFGRQASQVGRQFANSVMPNIASMYSQAGRYGSGAMGEGLGQAQQQFGNTLNDLAANTYGQNYANERQLQQGAQTYLGSLGLAGNAQKQQALESAGNMGLQSRQLAQSALGQAGTLGLNDRQLQQSALSSFNQSQLEGRNQQINALTQQGNLYAGERQRMMQANALAPQLEQMRYLAPQTLLNVGGAQDQYQQSLINADKQRFDFGQQQPYNQMQFLNSIMNGVPMGKDITQTGGTNPFLQTLGGVNAAAGTYRNLAPLFAGGASDAAAILPFTGGGAASADLMAMGFL